MNDSGRWSAVGKTGISFAVVPPGRGPRKVSRAATRARRARARRRAAQGSNGRVPQPSFPRRHFRRLHSRGVSRRSHLRGGAALHFGLVSRAVCLHAVARGRRQEIVPGGVAGRRRKDGCVALGALLLQPWRVLRLHRWLGRDALRPVWPADLCLSAGSGSGGRLLAPRSRRVVRPRRLLRAGRVDADRRLGRHLRLPRRRLCLYRRLHAQRRARARLLAARLDHAVRGVHRPALLRAARRGGGLRRRLGPRRWHVRGGRAALCHCASFAAAGGAACESGRLGALVHPAAAAAAGERAARPAPRPRPRLPPRDRRSAGGRAGLRALRAAVPRLGAGHARPLLGALLGARGDAHPLRPPDRVPAARVRPLRPQHGPGLLPAPARLLRRPRRAADRRHRGRRPRRPPSPRCRRLRAAALSRPLLRLAARSGAGRADGGGRGARVVADALRHAARLARLRAAARRAAPHLPPSPRHGRSCDPPAARRGAAGGAAARRAAAAAVALPGGPRPRARPRAPPHRQCRLQRGRAGGRLCVRLAGRAAQATRGTRGGCLARGGGGGAGRLPRRLRRAPRTRLARRTGGLFGWSSGLRTLHPHMSGARLSLCDSARWYVMPR